MQWEGTNVWCDINASVKCDKSVENERKKVEKSTSQATQTESCYCGI